MQYLKKIGSNARIAFEQLKKVNHTKIKKVLEDYNSSLRKIKVRLLKKILKILKMLRENT